MIARPNLVILHLAKWLCQHHHYRRWAHDCHSRSLCQYPPCSLARESQIPMVHGDIHCLDFFLIEYPLQPDNIPSFMNPSRVWIPHYVAVSIMVQGIPGHHALHSTVGNSRDCSNFELHGSASPQVLMCLANAGFIPPQCMYLVALTPSISTGIKPSNNVTVLKASRQIL